VTDLEWHHAACVYDAEAGTTRIYLDGIPAGSQVDTGTPRTGGDPLFLGARYSNGNVLRDWFKGRLDLVQVASGVLHRHGFAPPHELQHSSGGYVSLRWTVPDLGLVRGYNVYRQVEGEEPGVRKLNTAGLCTDLFYTDDEPHPGTDCYWVQAVNAHGVESPPTGTTCASFVMDEVPSDAAVRPPGHGAGLRVAPNPMRSGTRVSFRLDAVRAPAHLALYDVAGRRVRHWDLHDLPGGQGSLDVTGPDGRELGAGVYFLRLRSGASSTSTRLVVLQ
jgi:hypothetical protein